jgi:phenylacetate-CoA ligase
MNKLIEKAYFNVPVKIQNIIISIYGYHLYKRRFSRGSKGIVDQLCKNETLSYDEIKLLQETLFLRLVSHAFESVPFYREYSKNKGLKAKDIKSLADITKLPIVTKDLVRNNPESFCSDKYLGERDTFWLSTSGTSGKPLKILCDTESRRHHYAFWTRFRKWCGIDYGAKRATFFGRIIMSPDRNKPPFWRYDLFGRNYLFSSYHMSETNVKYYYNKLAALNLPELIGYPSSLYTLAKYCKKHNLEELRPKAVITTAETLLDHQRDLMEKAFQCEVFDQYGSTEMVHFVSQCEHGSYHIHPEHGYIEVLDHKGERALPGIAGTAVCTGFVNMAMPLIRYNLGDQIVIEDKKCACGRAFPVVKQIIGRMDDIIMSPDGRPLGRLDPVFKGLSGIYETQIIQSDIHSLNIKMVVDPAFSEQNMQEFLYELRKRIGNIMNVTITKVDEIPKESNGKFRPVISMLKDNYSRE